jgi:hypothetical protein
MKPWEETWKAVGADLEYTPEDPKLFVGLSADEDADDPVFHARARLAAQAPAMARLLLDLAGKHATCPDCGAFEETAHFDGCRFIVVMRDAGVIP